MEEHVTDETQWLEKHMNAARDVKRKMHQLQLDEQDLQMKLLGKMQAVMRKNSDLVKLLSQTKNENAEQKRVLELREAELAQTKEDLLNLSAENRELKLVNNTLDRVWKHEQEVASLTSNCSVWEDQYQKAERDLHLQAKKIAGQAKQIADLQQASKRQRTASPTGVESGTTGEQ